MSPPIGFLYQASRNPHDDTDLPSDGGSAHRREQLCPGSMRERDCGKDAGAELFRSSVRFALDGWHLDDTVRESEMGKRKCRHGFSTK